MLRRLPTGTALFWAGCLLLALAALPSPAHAEEPSRLFSLETHKPNYFVVSWDTEPHEDRQDKEVKFQLSVKKRLLDRTPIYAAYTQLANWQWFNGTDSRPFRTQTHNPEVFLDTPLDPLLGGQPGLRLGIEHESNGQPTIGSRSWNRGYAWPRIEFPNLENLSISVKAWARLPEPKKKNPEDPAGDDNPDIEEFLGHGELYVSQFSQAPSDRLPYRRVALMLRKGTKADTTTAQLDLEYHLYDVWNFFNEGIYLHVQYFYGYGESLSDYNVRVKKFGLGFSFY